MMRSDNNFTINDDGYSPDEQSPPMNSPPSKSFFEHIGGMDGVMSIMGQFQQAYGLYKQMRPTFDLFSSFMQPKAFVQNVNSHKNRNKSSRSRNGNKRANSHAAYRKRVAKGKRI